MGTPKDVESLLWVVIDIVVQWYSDIVAYACVALILFVESFGGIFEMAGDEELSCLPVP